MQPVSTAHQRRAQSAKSRPRIRRHYNCAARLLSPSPDYVFLSMKLISLLITACLFLSAGGASAGTAEGLEWTYRSPASGSRLISPSTTLALRHGDLIDPSSIGADLFYVMGDRSGAHKGEARLAADGRTLLFVPEQAFAEGETVTVEVAGGVRTVGGRTLPPTRYAFSTLPHKVPVVSSPGSDYAPAPGLPDKKLAFFSYLTYPELSNIAPITVTTPASGTASGYIFLAAMGIFQVYDPALYILDDAGVPVYIQNTPVTLPRRLAADFKKQRVNGQDFIVYHLGWQPNVGWSNGKAYALDQTYTLTNTWSIGNGYEDYGADLHDIQLLDNGHALLLSYVPVPMDLSPYGGAADGSVVDIVVQEQDAAHNVVFEWHGVQHIALTSTYASLTATVPIDYIHTNAIEMDSDGNVLLSNRNTSEIIKIDRSNGNILWHLGGKLNQFNFGGDPGISLPHDIRRLGNGNITLFDNGNLHSPPASRQVEYEIDEVSKVLTKTWQFPAANERYTPIMGNTQRLANGNTIGSWAVRRQVTEVKPDGSVALELALDEWTYRAFRDTWVATPRESPRLVALRGSDPTTATLYFAWNGATDIQSYEVYAGPALTSATLVTTTVRTGFETTLALSGLPADTCVYQVRPMRATGPSLPLSNAVYRMEAPACLALLRFTYVPVVMR